ncbi:MAG: signal recognition particle protein [Candidatus Pacearchaeota archaeon]|nr:MAG: signal recognition particle protein [Candidatus Pacearchaeota archaeon]
MFEKLSEILKKATNRIANALFLDKNLVESIIKDLQRALIEADVNVSLVKEFSEKIRKAAYDERIKGLEKKEHLIKVLYDELMNILGKKEELVLGKEEVIMLVGLYGSGKTTTIAKLGNYYQKRGRKVILIGLDTHRPAASEQLKQLSEKNKIAYFIDENEKDPLKVWKNPDLQKNIKRYDLVLIDSAGRHSLDKDLISELKALNKEIKPTKTILVMPADIGQAAKKQAKDFSSVIPISGIIITRMDSSAKGGGALTACAETKAPVFFITNGEKINDIEEFNPKSFVSRLLGMGDLETLIEKVKTAVGDKKQDLKKLESDLFTIEEFVDQAKKVGDLGGLEKIKSFIPGFSSAKIPEGLLENQEKRIEKWEHIIKSMTPEERKNPELLEKQTSRISRIAKGSGVNTSDVRLMLKQYNLLKEFLKTGKKMDGDFSKGLSQKQLLKLAKKFGKFKNLGF